MFTYMLPCMRDQSVQCTYNNIPDSGWVTGDRLEHFLTMRVPARDTVDKHL